MGFEKTLSPKEKKVFAELRNNPDSTAEEVADVIGGTYQSVQQARTRMNRKMERYAESKGQTMEEMGQTLSEKAAKKSDKSKPIDVSKRGDDVLTGEDMVSGGMKQIESPGGSEIDIAATTKGKVVMDSLTGKPVKDADTYFEQNDPKSKLAQKPVKQFWTQERKGMEGMPTWDSLSKAEKAKVTAAYQKELAKGKAQWQYSVTAGTKTIAGKIIG
jgi:hypothetical protein